MEKYRLKSGDLEGLFLWRQRIASTCTHFKPHLYQSDMLQLRGCASSFGGCYGLEVLVAKLPLEHLANMVLGNGVHYLHATSQVLVWRQACCQG